MKKFIKIIKKFEFPILMIVFFWGIFEPLRWPFFYPATTWGVMKGLVILLFGWTCWNLRKKKLFGKNKTIFLPILVYLLTNIISVFKAADIDQSLRIISYLLIGIIFYFLAFYHFKNKSQILISFKLIFYLSLFVSVVSFLTLIFSDYFKNLWLLFLPADTVEMYYLNIGRGRIEPLWALQMAMPIIVYFMVNPQKIARKYLVLLTFVLAILAVTFSNNRYQFISAFLSGFVYLLLIKSKKLLMSKKKIIIGCFLLVVLGSLISKAVFGRSILERLFFLDYWQDVNPLETRVSLAKEAMEMFLSSPILGIGLANFSLNVTNPEYSLEQDWLYGKNYLSFLSFETPHNIFLQLLAETGLIGFFAFIWILRNFLKQDFALLKAIKNEDFKILILAAVFSSWVYIVDNLTSIVSTSAMNLVYFWFIRGMLAAIYYQKDFKKEFL